MWGSAIMYASAEPCEVAEQSGAEGGGTGAGGAGAGGVGGLARQVNRFSPHEVGLLMKLFEENELPSEAQRQAIADKISCLRARRAGRLGPGEKGPARRPIKGTELPVLSQKNVKYWFDHQRRTRAKLRRERRMAAKKGPKLETGPHVLPHMSAYPSTLVGNGGDPLSAVITQPVPPPQIATGHAIAAAYAMQQGRVPIQGPWAGAPLETCMAGHARMAQLMQENPVLAGFIAQALSRGGTSSLQWKTFLPGQILVDQKQSLGFTLCVCKGFVLVKFFSSAEGTTAMLGPGSILRVPKCDSSRQLSLSITSQGLSQVYIAYQ